MILFIPFGLKTLTARGLWGYFSWCTSNIRLQHILANPGSYVACFPWNSPSFLTGATFLFLPFLYILLKVAAEVHSCCLTRYNSNSVQVYEELVQWWLKGCAFISPWQLSREWFAYAFSKGFFGTCIRLGRIVFYSTRRVPRFNTL